MNVRALVAMFSHLTRQTLRESATINDVVVILKLLVIAVLESNLRENFKKLSTKDEGEE